MHFAFRKDISVALVALTALSSSACTIEVGEDEGSGIEASVSAMLQTSAEAWNDGDLDTFLAMYSASATTSFLAPDGPVQGIEQIRDWYAPAFAPGADRDSLRFEQIQVRQLPPLIGVVTGKWVLSADVEADYSGWFTMVVRRVGNGWRVIHDHPSVGESQ
jgi:ketosteroid isomerase-like protein